MEQERRNYSDSNVFVFEQFGDVFQSEGESRQWTVQQKFSDMNMVMLLVCCKGTVQLRLNGHDYETKAGQGLVLLPSAVFERLMVSPDIHIRGFGLSVTAMESMFHTYQRTWKDALSLYDNPLVQLSEAQIQVTKHLYEISRQAEAMTDNRYYRPMMRSLAQSLLYMMADVVSQKGLWYDENVSMTQKERLFKRFVSLLWASGGRHRSVNYFAEQLCITPKYLATIVRESSGKTCTEMIHRYTANMIAQRLCTTNMTIKEICSDMNFPNESFFGRFVKKHLGSTPREYREKSRQSDIRPDGMFPLADGADGGFR